MHEEEKWIQNAKRSSTACWNTINQRMLRISRHAERPVSETLQGMLEAEMDITLDIPSMTTRTKRQTIAVMVIVLKLSPLQWND